MTSIRNYALGLGALALLFTACDPDDNSDDNGNPSGNTIEPDTLACSDISQATTLVNRGEGIDYLVPCFIEVHEQLTIEPGVTIAFEQDAGFEFNNYDTWKGSLTAVGTEVDSIRFTGALGMPGSWKGLLFDSDDLRNKMSYCVVEYAGGSSGDSYGIYTSDESRLALSHSLISRNNGVGMRASRASDLSGMANNTFRANGSFPVQFAANQIKYLSPSHTFQENGKAEIYVNSNSLYDRGYLEGQNPHTWHAHSIPYYVDETIFVGERTFGHFIIEAGAVLSFSEETSISVNENQAVLEINGSANAPVKLEGRNGSGSWNGVWVETNATQNRIEHTLITDAGQEKIGHWFSNGAALSLGRSTSTTQIELNDVTLANSAGCGIAESGTVTINSTNLQFQNIAGNNFCN